MVLPNGQIVPATSTGIPAQSGGNNPVLGAPGATGLGMLPSGVAIQQNAQNTPPLPPQLGGPPGSAANLINQILTTPRPGGQPQPGFPAGQGIGANTGATPTGTSTGSLSAPQGQVIGAGLAGVASKREQEGIKSYNSHTKYNEWEFVFDITKDPRLGRGGAAGGTGGGAGANPNQNGGGGGSTMGPNMGGATTTGAGPGR